MIYEQRAEYFSANYQAPKFERQEKCSQTKIFPLLVMVHSHWLSRYKSNREKWVRNQSTNNLIYRALNVASYNWNGLGPSDYLHSVSLTVL